MTDEAAWPGPPQPPMSRRFPTAALLVLLLLLLLPTLLLWRVVFTGDVFLPADLLRDIAPWRAATRAQMVPWNPLLWDGMAEFYPWRLFAAESLRAGWLPLWNPHQLCGTPFVANSQSAVFYPLNLLFCLMPVARAFGVSVWLHLALTGLFFYGFLRSGALRLSPSAALLGAVTWQLSAWQVSWLALPTFLCVSCWLPLALWMTWRAAAPDAPRSGEAGRWAALGVCLGVMVLAGHLQIALYCLGLTTAYALFLLWPQRRLPPLALLAPALMLGLAAPQLLPTVELARVSHRSGAPVTWHSYHQYISLALPPLNLITLYLPGFFGNPTQGTYWGVMTNGGPSAYMENACYVGILALGLAFLGVARTWRQNRATRFFALAALIALLMALGTPLDALPYFGLPGFAQSGSPGRILVLWTFCAAILAAVGTEALATRAPAWNTTTFGAGVSFLAAFLLSAGGTVFWVERYGQPHALEANLPRVGDLWRVPLGVLLGAAALLWLRQRGTLPSRAMGFFFALLAATDLLAANGSYNHTAPLGQVYPVTPAIAYLQQHLGTERVLVVNQGWSIDPSRPPQAILPPNAATVYGLNDISGYDSLLTRRSFKFVESLDGGQNPAPPENGNMVFADGLGSPQARAAAARYILTPQPLPELDPEQASRRILQDNGMFLYDDPVALPRARMSGEGRAALVRDIAPTRVGIQTAGAEGGELVLADQWYPGWQARAGPLPWRDARRVDIGLTQGMFRQMVVRPEDIAGNGASIELRYLPATFRVGLYGFCLALAGTFGIVAGRLGRRRGG